MQDGTWRYCFGSGTVTDAYMIVLLRSLEMNEEGLIKRLAKSIERRQEDNGAWKLFHDQKEGDLSATIESYYALLFSGYVDKNAPNMEKALSFIRKNGGMNEAGLFTEVLLSITGQYEWPESFHLPIQFLLLPTEFPVNFYDMVGFARVNVAPVLILLDKKFKIIVPSTPNLNSLLSRKEIPHWPQQQNRFLFDVIEEGIKKLFGLPEYVHEQALERARQYMFTHVEKDSTLYSYFSSTFLMIFALLALGYKKDHPTILKAVEGLKTFVTETEEGTHLQFTTSTVWDTALLSYGLQEAGVSSKSETIQKANAYLLSRQHHKYGDWVLHNSNALPGGWGFSNINTINPDVDDSTAAMRAIRKLAIKNKIYNLSWQRGMQWVLSMQNDDGGWPAFEREVNDEWVKALPVKRPEALLLDPSMADLTGRTLEFLGKDTKVDMEDHRVQRAVQWLTKNQEEDGSWYGRWGICYIYGTWAAVTGMRAVGVPVNHLSLQKAKDWFLRIQNEDGGWGESCYSDIEKKYVPLGGSTPSQTAWALDALIALSDHPTHEMNRGIDCLLDSLNEKNWTFHYPTGGGLPGGFYIQYESYQYIWPLITLAHYWRKYLKEN